jgi:lysophospholipase L1-like esterase
VLAGIYIFHKLLRTCNISLTSVLWLSLFDHDMDSIPVLSTQNLCESQNDVFFINNCQSVNHNYRSAFQRDGIHFSETGKRAFVRLIKTHLNMNPT